MQLKSNIYHIGVESYQQNTEKCQTRNYKLFSEQELTSTQYLTSLIFESENYHWIINVAVKFNFEMQF